MERQLTETGLSPDRVPEDGPILTCSRPGCNNQIIIRVGSDKPYYTDP